ncbi:MAG: hypothetical protein QF583_02725 [Rhodospirillales bacterium]|nr:hypothetical protein [Rhodospirillales bacterium]HJP54643.1 hypothetical protein [Rhodospirillales bacterium]
MAAMEDVLEVYTRPLVCLDEASRQLIAETRMPPPKWHDIIGEPSFADAILERIVHNAHGIDPDEPKKNRRPPLL